MFIFDKVYNASAPASTIHFIDSLFIRLRFVFYFRQFKMNSKMDVLKNCDSPHKTQCQQLAAAKPTSKFQHQQHQQQNETNDKQPYNHTTFDSIFRLLFGRWLVEYFHPSHIIISIRSSYVDCLLVQNSLIQLEKV